MTAGISVNISWAVFQRGDKTTAFSHDAVCSSDTRQYIEQNGRLCPLHYNSIKSAQGFCSVLTWTYTQLKLQELYIGAANDMG